MQAEVLKHSETRVLDGNKEGRKPLFSDNAKFMAKPDIVLRHLDSVVALADVKYKASLSESDRYQLIAHANSYETKNAFFITPTFEQNSAGGTYIGTTGSIRMFHYQLDLDSIDLFSAEAKMHKWVDKLIHGDDSMEANSPI
jgi:5-methylcytosine-specific restriction enzyme subunit McrC